MRITDKEKGRGLTPVEQVFIKHIGELRYFLSRFLTSEPDIEDVLQDTYIRAVEAEKTTKIRAPKAFLYKVSKNLALNYKSQAYGRLTDLVADFDELLVLSEGPLPEKQVEYEKQFVDFCRGVKLLPDKCRRVFILRKIYGFSNQEIADRLGISVSTVETHLARGLLTCKNYLKIKGYSFSDLNISGKSTKIG